MKVLNSYEKTKDNRSLQYKRKGNLYKHPNDLTAIRECLVNFKNNGMDKESMLESLEQLRSGSSSEEEDILLELMVLNSYNVLKILTSL